MNLKMYESSGDVLILLCIFVEWLVGSDYFFNLLNGN